MDYQILEKPEFNIVGKSIRVPMKDNQNFSVIPKFWGDTMADGTVTKLWDLFGPNSPVGDVMLGVCSDFAPDMSEFSYWVAVPADDDKVPDGFSTLKIPALTWASFESVGALPDAIQATWQKIFSEFFAAGEYVHGPGPELELYGGADTSSPDYRCQIWVPVVKK